MSEAETVGMVLLALVTIFGAFAMVARPLMRLDQTLVTLEASIDRLKELIEEQREKTRDHEKRLDEAEKALIDHDHRLRKMEDR